MAEKQTPTEPQDAAGLEDVLRSVRTLTGSARDLGESAVGVAERELGMAVQISSRLRDEVIATETLEKARSEDLPARFRRDAHQVADLVADAGAMAFLVVQRFVDGFINEKREETDARDQG